MDGENMQSTGGGSGAGKWIVGVVVLVLVVWGLVAASKNKNQNQNKEAGTTQTGPYKIGVLLPLTGDAASYGEAARNVYQFAVDEINSSGGVNDNQLELVVEDSKCNGKDASSAMQKLVNVDKVQIVLGGFCSSESLASEPIATANKVLLFSPGSSSPNLTNVSPYFFRNYPSDASQGKALAEVAYNKKGWRTVAFMQEQTDYALGIYQAFTKTFESLGGKVLKEEFATAQTDFRSQLTKLRNEKADALFLDTQTPASAERVLKQMRDLGWKPSLLVSDIMPGDIKNVEANKDMLEGALAAEFGIDQSNPLFKKLVDSYKQKYGVDMPFQAYGQTEYDALYIIKAGITAVGYNGEKLAAWSRTIKDWEGASGKTTIQPDGDRASGHMPEVIKNGKVEPYRE